MQPEEINEQWEVVAFDAMVLVTSPDGPCWLMKPAAAEMLGRMLGQAAIAAHAERDGVVASEIPDVEG